MDSLPTEKQPAGTVSLLDDGPQRSTSVFCSFSLFVFHHCYFNLVTARPTFFNAFTADSGSDGFMSTAWNRLHESHSLWHVELISEF